MRLTNELFHIEGKLRNRVRTACLADLARTSGVSLSTVQHFKSGKRGVTLHTLKTLAKHFDQLDSENLHAENDL